VRYVQLGQRLLSVTLDGRSGGGAGPRTLAGNLLLTALPRVLRHPQKCKRRSPSCGGRRLLGSGVGSAAAALEPSNMIAFTNPFSAFGQDRDRRPLAARDQTDSGPI